MSSDCQLPIAIFAKRLLKCYHWSFHVFLIRSSVEGEKRTFLVNVWNEWFLWYLVGSSHLISLLHLVLLVYDYLLVHVASYLTHDGCVHLLDFFRSPVYVYVVQVISKIVKSSHKKFQTSSFLERNGIPTYTPFLGLPKTSEL